MNCCNDVTRRTVLCLVVLICCFSYASVVNFVTIEDSSKVMSAVVAANSLDASSVDSDAIKAAGNIMMDAMKFLQISCTVQSAIFFSSCSTIVVRSYLLVAQIKQTGGRWVEQSSELIRPYSCFYASFYLRWHRSTFRAIGTLSMAIAVHGLSGKGEKEIKGKKEYFRKLVPWPLGLRTASILCLSFVCHEICS